MKSKIISCFIFLTLIFAVISIEENDYETKNEMKFLEDIESNEFSLENLTISQFNSKVISTAKKNAKPTSQGYCAKYVADAIDSTGTHVSRMASAYQYGQNLINIGYKLVSCSSTQPGDIYVIDKTSAHVHGHICIKGDDGAFYSDFKQRNACPYSDGCPVIKCYRHD